MNSMITAASEIVMMVPQIRIFVADQPDVLVAMKIGIAMYPMTIPRTRTDAESSITLASMDSLTFTWNDIYDHPPGMSNSVFIIMSI